MEFTLDLHSKLDIYQVVSPITYIASEALAEQVVDRIHTNHFLSGPDHQLNETQRKKFVSQLYRG